MNWNYDCDLRIRESDPTGKRVAGESGRRVMRESEECEGREDVKSEICASCRTSIFVSSNLVSCSVPLVPVPECG